MAGLDTGGARKAIATGQHRLPGSSAGTRNTALMIASLLHRTARTLLSVPAVLLRRDTAKDAELLVLRQENAILRRACEGQGALRADRPIPARRSGVAGWVQFGCCVSRGWLLWGLWLRLVWTLTVWWWWGSEG